jgi:phosphoribosyl 1,2-cyclic phosphodiesterase
MLVRFWGVHGSLPRPGPKTVKFGGNTACVEVQCGENLLIFDGGSGIRELGIDLLHRSRKPSGDRQRIGAHIFLSHYHWDHIQGLPFFGPAYVEGNRLELYGRAGCCESLRDTLAKQMSEPNFPISLDRLRGLVAFHELESGSRVQIDDVSVDIQALAHPGGCLAFKVTYEDKALIYATDAEHLDGLDQALVQFAKNVDLLIHDSMFTPDQYVGLTDGIPKKLWGHGTWETAVSLARAAEVKRLILFHHGNEDSVVEEMERAAARIFSETTAAYEGLEIEL